jgi:hypothetical protein
MTGPQRSWALGVYRLSHRRVLHLLQLSARRVWSSPLSHPGLAHFLALCHGAEHAWKAHLSALSSAVVMDRHGLAAVFESRMLKRSWGRVSVGSGSCCKKGTS